MKEFFEWIASLETEQAWLLFVCIALIMAIIPFLPTIIRILRILFSNEAPSIKDFSWRFIPDMKITDVKDMQFYVIKSENPVVYEGMVIMLNWFVEGSYRVDIQPLGKNLKGNSGFVVLNSEQCRFVLVAHTLKGKITAELLFDPAKIRKINTLNLSKEDMFGQQEQELSTGRYYYNENNFLSAKRKALFGRILDEEGRLYAAAKIKLSKFNRMYFSNKQDKRELNSYVNSTLKGGTFKFNPKSYNYAIDEYKKNNKKII
jgi:hypothetical protein